MPIGTGAAIIGSALIGGGASLFASNRQRDAANAGVAEQRQANQNQLAMFNQVRGDLSPFINTGTTALDGIRRLFPTEDGQSPDYSGFYRSPDYQFAFDEGERALNRSLAARGQLVSGNALRAATQFGQGMATQNFGNYFNRLMSMAGMGQNAAAGAGSMGMQSAGLGIQSANNIATGLNNAGAAAGSGVVGAANALTGGVNSYLNYNMFQNALNRGGSSYGS